MQIFLSFVWLIGSTTSAYFWFKPKREYPPFATRYRATGMFVAFFIGIPIISGVISPSHGSSAANAADVKPVVAHGAAPDTAAAPKAVETKWSVNEEVSALDDSKNVYAAVDADDKIKGWLTSERPTLTVRCKEGSIEAYVDTKSQITTQFDLDRGQTASIKYRVGTAPPVQVRTSLSSDGEALFLPKARSLVHSFMTVDRFVVEYTPFQSGLGVATFNIAGARDPMQKVLNACKAKA